MQKVLILPIFAVLFGIGVGVEAYESESFCKVGDFTIKGFESVENARINGVCAEFYLQLKSLGDDKTFIEKALNFSEYVKLQQEARVSILPQEEGD